MSACFSRLEIKALSPLFPKQVEMGRTGNQSGSWKIQINGLSSLIEYRSQIASSLKDLRLVVEIGHGGGILFHDHLCEQGFTGRYLGLDYSPNLQIPKAKLGYSSRQIDALNLTAMRLLIGRVPLAAVVSSGSLDYLHPLGFQQGDDRVGVLADTLSRYPANIQWHTEVLTGGERIKAALVAQGWQVFQVGYMGTENQYLFSVRSDAVVPKSVAALVEELKAR